MHEVVERFFIYLMTEKRVARNTFIAYKGDMVQFTDFCAEHSLDIKNIRRDQLQQFFAALLENQVTHRSLARKISCLKLFYAYAHERYGWLQSAASLTMPFTKQSLPRVLTLEQVNTLLETAALDTSLIGTRNKVMIYLLYATGMRISELIMLKKQDIKWDVPAVLLHGKGGKDRIIPLQEPLCHLLHDYIMQYQPKLLKAVHGASDYLFPVVHKVGVQPLSRQAFWIILKKIAAKSGCPSWLSPHVIRHSFATHLLAQGVNIRSLQLLLGHEKIDTVQVYTHVQTNAIRHIYDKKHPRS